VGDGEAAVGQFGEERLDVAHAGAAGGGVARVADGAVALQPVDHRLLGEGVADQADMALDVELRAVIGDDAGRFLAAMLQRVQAERDDRRGILPPEDAEHAAFVVEMVIGLGEEVFCVCHRGTLRPMSENRHIGQRPRLCHRDFSQCTTMCFKLGNDAATPRHGPPI